MGMEAVLIMLNLNGTCCHMRGALEGFGPLQGPKLGLLMMEI
jgi:hypothetical protein